MKLKDKQFHNKQHDKRDRRHDEQYRYQIQKSVRNQLIQPVKYLIDRIVGKHVVGNRIEAGLAENNVDDVGNAGQKEDDPHDPERIDQSGPVQTQKIETQAGDDQ